MDWQNSYHSEYPPENDSIKKLVGIVAVFAFVADLVLMIKIIGTLLELEFLYSSQPIWIQFAFVIVVYVFALALFAYSRSQLGERFEAVVYLLSWLYIILAAILWMIVSYRFVMDFDPDLGAFQALLYSSAILVISSFGALIARIVNEPVRHYVIPFLLATVWQLGLWIWRFAFDRSLPTIWNGVGSLLLFIFMVAYIFWLLSIKKDLDEDY